MKTQKYNSHSLKNKNGNFIACRKETEAILEMIYSGRDFVKIDGKTVSVFSDEIVTEGKDVKRVTVVEVSK